MTSRGAFALSAAISARGALARVSWRACADGRRSVAPAVRQRIRIYLGLAKVAIFSTGVASERLPPGGKSPAVYESPRSRAARRRAFGWGALAQIPRTSYSGRAGARTPCQGRLLPRFWCIGCHNPSFRLARGPCLWGRRPCCSIAFSPFASLRTPSCETRSRRGRLPEHGSGPE